MKQILIVLITLALLATSALCKSAIAIPLPPQLEARFSNIVPEIDGHLGSAEWNDTAMYNVSLIGDTNITTWLYVKHNATHIHIGLVIWSIGTHVLDEFIVAFDEGDDGGSGSGSRDYVLTPMQEDGKVVMSNHTLLDGYYNSLWYVVTSEIDFEADCAYETDHGTSDWEIEYWEGLSWVDDHWECEFSIPFVGNDEGVEDVSDLSCNVTDIIGIKIQYYYPSENYYFPEGSKMQVTTFADLAFPAPIVESCDSSGTKKDNFNLYEDVHVNGSCFLPNATYDFYVVNDTEIWGDGMPIPARIPGTATSITSDTKGVVSPVVAWADPSIVGAYDMIVDVNKNGLYDEGIDALDNNDEITAGFVIPELQMLLALLMSQFAAIAIIVSARKRGF